MFIFYFLKSARQWAWIKGLTGTSPSSNKANVKSCSGYQVSLVQLCSLGSCARLRSSLAEAGLGVLRDKRRWRCPTPSWAPEEHSWAGARKAILTLCAALPRLQLESCTQFWAPEDKIYMGRSPVKATKMIGRLACRSHGDRQRGLFSLENRRLGG